MKIISKLCNLSFFKQYFIYLSCGHVYRLNNETTIYITTIQTWIRHYETTFYVDYYKGFALSQFQSHKLVSIPFRVNWLILRSIVVQQRCRDSRNHRERNGEKSIYTHYHHSFLFPHRRQKVKLDKPMW